MEFTTLQYLPLQHSLQYSLSLESEILQTMWVNLTPVCNKYSVCLRADDFKPVSGPGLALKVACWRISDLDTGPVALKKERNPYTQE